MSSHNDNEMDCDIEERLLKLEEKVEGLGHLPVAECLQSYNEYLEESEAISNAVKTSFENLLGVTILNKASKTMVNTVRKMDIDDQRLSLQKLSAAVREAIFHSNFCNMETNDIFTSNYDISYTPMIPFFTPEAFEPVVQEARNRKRKRDDLNDVKQPKEGITGEERQEAIAHKILGTILKIFEDNGNKPIGYFELVLNPHSFSASVENIFHLSFLFKEGYIKLHYDTDGIPVISPISKTEGNNTSKKSDKKCDKMNTTASSTATSGEENCDESTSSARSSTMIQLNLQQWKMLVDSIGMKKPMLTVNTRLTH